jgi:diguanylate cyclase
MRIRFRARLTLLLLALFVLVQLPTFFAFYYATRESVLSQAKARLASGSRVFADLLHKRGDQLLEAVRVTTSDFAFKQAVATGDTPTIDSVLYNQGHRISADLMVLSALDGKVVASLDAGGHAMPAGDWSSLVAAAGEPDAGTMVTLINGRPYQLVIVPVTAPTRIAWVGMGFALDDKLAQDLKELAGVEVTFVAREGDSREWLRSTLHDLDAEDRRQLLAAAGQRSESTPVIALSHGDYFTQWRPLRQGRGELGALLQFSRGQALASYRALERQLVLIALLSLVGSLAGALWLSRNVTRPVSQLADAARRIGQGDYLAVVPVQHNDELGELAQAFNGMQDGIARRERQIAHQAFHDALTSLPNRVGLHQALEAALTRAAGTGHTVAVMMLDVDRFKEINDTMGHGIGDLVLIEIGRRLRGALRDDDVLARFGGDEFVVLMEGIGNEDVERRVGDLLDQVARPIAADAMELYLDVSVGMALFPEHGSSAEELLRRADIAMYDAKESRSRLQLYRNGRDAEHLYRLSLVNDLRKAVPNGELALHYQPKMQLHSGRIVSAEALLRWRHPQHGLVPPDDFIPLAEHSGIIRELTDWVLHEVIRQCTAWQQAGIEVGIALNLSAMDLGSGDLPTQLAGHLERYRLAPERLMLEITETAVMRDAVHSLEVLNRLKACGVMLAIDDFGTGYSSLSHLKRLPVDELKIDKSFVMAMAEDEDDAVIVRSTIELAHTMGLKVVAEGVETDAALEMLRAYRCDSVQGYLISRPLAADDATRWLAAANEAHARRTTTTQSEDGA